MRIFKCLTALLLLLSINAYSQDDQAEEWDTGKSNGGMIEKFGNKIGKKLTQIEKKRNAPVDAKVKQSLATIAKDWPANNKVVSFSPYGSSGMLQGGRYVYLQFKKDENNIINNVIVAFDLDDNKKLVNPKDYESYIPKMYLNNKWFFKDPLVKAYGGNTIEKIYVTPSSVVLYEVYDYGKPEVKDIIWIAGKKGKNQTAWMKEIEAFRRWGFEKDVTDQQDLAEAEKAFRAKYSLENKVVKGVKLVKR